MSASLGRSKRKAKEKKVELVAEAFPLDTNEVEAPEVSSSLNSSAQVAEAQPDKSSLSSMAVTPEIVEADELTPEEERDRQHLERKVERAFYEAGKALRELRDRRLYRSTHITFDEYCRARFGFTRRHPYYLIEAANVFDNLSEECEPLVHIFPTSERQVRPLSKLEAGQQRHIWQQAVEEAGGKVPSGRLVKNIVERLRERTRISNPYRVGEVCSLVVKGNPDLRGRGGSWCIVEEVHDFSCTVKVWDGRIQVKIEHLKEMPYSLEQREAMKDLSDRLSKLLVEDLEESVRGFLAGLGKLERPYLTELEEAIFKAIEDKLGF